MRKKEFILNPLTDTNSFITTWQTTSANETITIPTYSTATYNYNVHWGDSNTDTNQTGNAEHTYTVAGTHTVVITGDFPRIYFNDAGDKDKIIAVNQWGTGRWASMENAFNGATNLAGQATDPLVGIDSLFYLYCV